VQTSASLWKNKDELEDEIFDRKSFKKPISLKYLDFPGIHSYNQTSRDFF